MKNFVNAILMITVNVCFSDIPCKTVIIDFNSLHSCELMPCLDIAL